MNNQPQQSDPKQLRQAIKLPSTNKLRGNQERIWSWLTIRHGCFHAGSISEYAGLNIVATRTALASLVKKGLVQRVDWNDEAYDPMFGIGIA